MDAEKKEDRQSRSGDKTVDCELNESEDKRSGIPSLKRLEEILF